VTLPNTRTRGALYGAPFLCHVWGMTRVHVYKNLRRGDWSVRANGKVIGHASNCVLANVTFHVSEAARQRVIRNHCREVHAWVIGDLVDGGLAPAGERIPITYRPFDGGSFVRRDNGEPIFAAAFVHFTANDGAIAYD
jgi:hypothetical protein